MKSFAFVAWAIVVLVLLAIGAVMWVEHKVNQVTTKVNNAVEQVTETLYAPVNGISDGLKSFNKWGDEFNASVDESLERSEAGRAFKKGYIDAVNWVFGDDN